MIEPPLAPPWEGGETDASNRLNVTAPRVLPGETDALPLNATAPPILPLCNLSFVS